MQVIAGETRRCLDEIHLEAARTRLAEIRLEDFDEAGYGIAVVEFTVS